jgi:hypothetical protein
MPNKVFFAYPSQPEQLGATVESSIVNLRASQSGLEVKSWPQIDIAGRFLIEGILGEIDAADMVVADITRLNFNVLYEIGYAFGSGKRVVLTVNESLSPETRLITQLGMFDTVGYKTYSNAAELAEIVRSIPNVDPIRFPDYEIDFTAPVYIIDTLHKTDASIRIISKVKKARIRFRSFDPEEVSRLSLVEAFKGVSESIAVIVNLLSTNATDHWNNNLRGAFVAGLAEGLDKELVVFQEGEEPVPLDYRDLVTVYRHPNDVDTKINDLAPTVTEGLQFAGGFKTAEDRGYLASLDFGAPAAENEMDTLGDYYVATDAFDKVVRGQARIAVGRKGSGKSALFFQARDDLRRNRQRIVIDLKPDGHQLARFKALVLRLLDEAVLEHAVAAFWHYLLLLEICNKVLEKDRRVHLRNHILTELYHNLKEHYSTELAKEEGDFSERMMRIVNRVSDQFIEEYGSEEQVYLTPAQVTELIYRHDIHELEAALSEYLENKEGVYVLIDNIDKGWPTRGVEHADVVILRSLMDATRKLERSFRMKGITFQSTVFIRNDVYELLVDETPDRGKESKVSLDWTDVDLLKECIRKRIIYNDLDEDLSFDQAWHEIARSHIDGELTSEYLIHRSLMRPRNMLSLLNHCKSSAINLQHSKINRDDIDKACGTYSADICNEIGLEIRDVFPSAEDIVYYFIGVPSKLSLLEVRERLSESPVAPDEIDRLVEILLWFGFLGVCPESQVDGEVKYIYSVYYDMKMLKALAKNFRSEGVMFEIHCAFWPFLGIS